MYKLPEINLVAKEKTSLDLPPEIVSRKMVVLCMIGSVAWDYAKTVIDLAGLMKLKDFVKMSRLIRQYSEEYGRVMLLSLSPEHIKAVDDLGLLFQEGCNQHLSKLSASLHNEKEISRCRDDYRYLVVAVQMAMTVIDALKLYAADFDDYLNSEGVRGKSVEIAQIRQLAILLPQYAGDAYNTQSPSRSLTAKILYNELKLCERNGIEPDGADDA